MPKEIAKEVYDFKLKKVVDRTLPPHEVGTFDIDFKNINGVWIYGASTKTFEKAMSYSYHIKKELGTEVRIVNSLTGKVIKKI